MAQRLSSSARHRSHWPQPTQGKTSVADLDALAGSVRPQRHHLAEDLVAEDQGRLQAEGADRRLLRPAEVEHAFPEMQIRVADAAVAHLDQDLGPGRRGRRRLDFLQGLFSFQDGPGPHRRSSCEGLVRPGR